MKIKYLQMMNIDEDKILQGFHRTHIAERTRTPQEPLIEDCSKLKLIIYSVPWDRALIPNTLTPIFRIIFRLHQRLPVLTANKSFRYIAHWTFPVNTFFYK